MKRLDKEGKNGLWKMRGVIISCYHISDTYRWVRVFGYGISFSTKLMFSPRHGLSKYWTIGKWHISFLDRPFKIASKLRSLQDQQILKESKTHRYIHIRGKARDVYIKSRTS